MTDEQQTLDLIRRQIATLPADAQAQIQSAASALRATIHLHGEHGYCALALVGAELAASGDV